MEIYDVAVIGAGISGLATAKNVLDGGLSVIVLEQSDHVGGLWQYQEKGYGVMDFTHINVSKYNYCFSDFPFADDVPDFPHHKDMAKYVNLYADANGLRQHIVFHRKVTSLLRSDHLWTITAEPTDQSGKTETYKCRHVAVATGHHTKPRRPQFEGQNTFPGRIIHSVDYKSARINGVDGKRLLVVGIGNSAVDVASDAALSGYCNVTVSTRSGVWVLPNYVFGNAIDLYACRLALWLPWQFLNFITETVIRLVTGHPKTWGLNPKMKAMQAHPTISNTLIHCIQRGYVTIKPNVLRINGNKVIFTDGSTTHIDDIVVCTGYSIDLPFLGEQLRAEAVQESTNVLQLYKNVFHPDTGHSLAFIGFVQPSTGGILAVSETQARWFVELCKGNAHLPFRDTMKCEIRQDRAKMEKRYRTSARHTLQCDPLIYNDEVASCFGAKPSLWRHPNLAWRLLLGSGGAAQWRLQGPGKWDKARESVRNVPVTGLMTYPVVVTVFAVLFSLVYTLVCLLA